jgi:DNA-binding MarR family transcriptional regulator
VCEEMQFDLTSISYDTISDNCKITIPTATRIVKKLISDGLIAYEQGDYKKKIANKYKVLFPTKQIETQTINQSEKSTAFSQCEKITINNYINELELKELKELVINQSKQILDLKDSMINLHKKFSVVEKIADTLLSYIDEIEHDLDNVYMLNNIQRPKPQCKCSIFDIRKILDENKQ